MVNVSRRVALVAALFMIGCGGGASPTGFADAIRPLGDAFGKAVAAQKKDEVQKIFDKAKQFYDQKRMTNAEFAVFQAAYDYVQSDKWDKAGKLIGDSLKISK